MILGTKGAASKKIRVLLILESQGGSARHVIDLLRGLDHDRFETALIYGTSRIDSRFAQSLPQLEKVATLIPCDYLRREISVADDRRALSFIRRVISDYHPDVVHCHSSKAGALGRVAAKRENVPVIFYTPHAYSFQSPEFSGVKRPIVTFVERWLSRKATTATFNVSYGERGAALDANLDVSKKFKVIENGIGDEPVPTRDESRIELGLPLGVPVVGVTARFAPQKDPWTFAQIAVEVIQRNPDVHVVYMGEGPLMEDIVNYWSRMGVAARTHVIPARPDADMLVSAFDVYLLTSLYEGMPYSLIESLRAGVPVVATDVAGNNEVVVSHVNGELFPMADVRAGAEAVLKMIDHPLPSEAVCESFRERFTSSRMISRIESEYVEAVDHARA